MQVQKISIGMKSRDGNDKICCNIFKLNLIMGWIRNACSDCLEWTDRIWCATLCIEQFIVNASSLPLPFECTRSFHSTGNEHHQNQYYIFHSIQNDTISLFRSTSQLKLIVKLQYKSLLPYTILRETRRTAWENWLFYHILMEKKMKLTSACDAMWCDVMYYRFCGLHSLCSSYCYCYDDALSFSNIPRLKREWR